jgi:hypothetical protein
MPWIGGPHKAVEGPRGRPKSWQDVLRVCGGCEWRNYAQALRVQWLCRWAASNRNITRVTYILLNVLGATF